MQNSSEQLLGLKPHANALDLSTVQALNMLSSTSWAHLNTLLSLVESNLKLVKLFAQRGSTFPLFGGHPCVAQQSRVHLHRNAQHVKPMHAQCPAYPNILSHDSTWAFVKSWDCSTCWVIVEVIWRPRSMTPQQTLNMLRACTVDKSSAFARSISLQPVSRDSDNNTAMYNCCWTNKRS